MQKWKSLSRNGKIVVVSGFILLGCILCAVFGMFLPQNNSEQLSQEDLVQTAMAEIVASSEAEDIDMSAPTEETEYQPTVYFVCNECVFSDGTNTSIVLWDTPDEIGDRGVEITHGEMCVLLETGTSQDGIEKRRIECSSGTGWVRSEAIYIPNDDRCLPASSQQISNLLAFVEDVEPSNYISNAIAVRSDDFENVWMVAAQINGGGIEEGQAIGVWAISGDQGNPSLTLSVNSFASEFSVAPLGSETEAEVTITSDGVEAAENCSRNAN